MESDTKRDEQFLRSLLLELVALPAETGWVESPRPLAKMARADRIRAVYQHACLRHVQREAMSNTSLRERFGIDTKNSATASRRLREALAEGVVKLQDESAPPKLKRYVPIWA
jgi:predicted HTH transcriptional regulator